MSLNKGVQHHKEHREEYRGANKPCRNHGTCAYCRESRTHKNDRRRLAMEAREREAYGEEN